MTTAAPHGADDARLLGKLLRAAGPLTIHALARQTGATERELRKQFDRLRTDGCELEFHPQRGVRLVRTGLSCWADYLEHSSGRAGRLVRVYRRTASTQDVSRQLLRDRKAAAVVADEQTAGRGRLGRRWLAPKGTAVMFSLVHVSRAVSADRLMLASAVGVAGAIESLLGPGGPPVRIKWPNDVLVGGLKVAGILVEMSSLGRRDWRSEKTTGEVLEGGVIGVGINVAQGIESMPDAPPELKGRITSLAAAGRSIDRLLVLAEALAGLDCALAVQDTAVLLESWRARSTLLSQRVLLQTAAGPVRGEVIDLDASDGLIVRTDTGTMIHLPAATTTILGPG